MNKKERKKIKQQAAHEEAKAYLAQHAADEEAKELQMLEQIMKPQQTSFEQARESGGKLISTLVCIAFVIVVVLLIVGSCAS